MNSRPILNSLRAFVFRAESPSKGFEEPAVERIELPEHIPMIEQEIPQEFLDSSRVIKVFALHRKYCRVVTFKRHSHQRFE